jgi:hypothetical protein
MLNYDYRLAAQMLPSMSRFMPRTIDWTARLSGFLADVCTVMIVSPGNPSVSGRGISFLRIALDVRRSPHGTRRCTCEEYPL